LLFGASKSFIILQFENYFTPISAPSIGNLDYDLVVDECG